MILTRTRCPRCHDAFIITRHYADGIRFAARDFAIGVLYMIIFALCLLVPAWIYESDAFTYPQHKLVLNLLGGMVIGRFICGNTLWETLATLCVAWIASSILFVVVILGMYTKLTAENQSEMMMGCFFIMLLFTVCTCLYYMLPFGEKFWHALDMYRLYSVEVHAV